MITEITHEGRTYYNVPLDGEGTGLPAEVIDAAVDNQGWTNIRAQRDAALRACDYAVMPDYPLSDAQTSDVRKYRQALRDLPAMFDAPGAIKWPTKPKVLA